MLPVSAIEHIHNFKWQVCLIPRSLLPCFCLSAGPSNIFTSYSPFLKSHPVCQKPNSIALARTSNNTSSDVNSVRAEAVTVQATKLLVPASSMDLKHLMNVWLHLDEEGSVGNTATLPLPHSGCCHSWLILSCSVIDLWMARRWQLTAESAGTVGRVTNRTIDKYQLQASTCSSTLGCPDTPQNKHAYVHTCTWHIHTHENGNEQIIVTHR